MDDILVIQVTNQKAGKLLQELEKLHLIKVLEKKSIPSKIKLSEKYKGSISKQQGQNLDDHIRKMRNEWNAI